MLGVKMLVLPRFQPRLVPVFNSQAGINCPYTKNVKFSIVGEHNLYTDGVSGESAIVHQKPIVKISFVENMYKHESASVDLGVLLALNNSRVYVYPHYTVASTFLDEEGQPLQFGVVSLTTGIENGDARFLVAEITLQSLRAVNPIQIWQHLLGNEYSQLITSESGQAISIF